MKRITGSILTGLIIVTLSCNQGSNANSPGDKDLKNEQWAVFAGGCFWCMEPPFEKHNGVSEAVSGYAGGTKEDPSYEEVSSGQTEYIEAVKVYYDTNVISYGELLDIYWRQIDPADSGGQFADRGKQYQPAIFYRTEHQKQLAESSKTELARSGPFDAPIVVKIKPFTTFYRAEEYHQDYYKKNEQHYKRYREGSGREGFLDSIWGDSSTKLPDTTNNYTKPPDSVLVERLTDLQYRVTQKDDTEPPFQNKYWDNKEPGIYVDIVSGEPLFSSKDKYKSGTGWPSFTRPLEPENVIQASEQIPSEVRSKHADSHLGHVFSDGPLPTGLRYCINSAALEFIPADRLEEKGYGEYKGSLE